MAELTPSPPDVRLRDVAGLFLKLGTIAFGGPAAHVAMMEDEVVRRRGWLSREDFLDLLGAANLIPGPNSTELAIHIGHRVAGAAGLVVAGVCFIVPASLIVTLIAWAYVAGGQLPATGAALAGIKPVILAVVFQALWGLAGKAAATWPLRGLGVLAAGLALAGVNELALLLGAGLLVALARGRGAGPVDGAAPLGALTALPWAPAPLLAATAPTPFGLWPLFGFFLKVGAVLYGSGYVLLAFLRTDLVERWGWLTQAQLLDAVAVGQITPGPVFTTATFVGYLLGGVPGAVVATVGIFLPAFCFVAASGPLVPRLRRSAVAGAFLDGVNVASVALMAAVTLQLAPTALSGPWTAALAGGSALALIRYRVNSATLVAVGAIAGLAGAALAGR